MRRRGRPEVLVAGLVLATAAAAAALTLLSPRSHRATADAVPSGAYARGGVPIHDAAADELFGRALPRFVIALAAWRDDPAALDLAHAALDEAAAALPDRTGSAARELAVVARAAAADFTAPLDDAGDELIAASRALDVALAADGLGYFVDAQLLEEPDLSARHLVIATFTVEEVVFYDGADTELGALRLRRLDDLNWRYRMLGFSAEQGRYATVLAGEVEARAVALATAAGGVVDPATLGQDAKLRGEMWWPAWSIDVVLALAAELDSPAARRVSSLLATRARLFSTWNDRASRLGYELAAPTRLHVVHDYRAELGELATAAELERLDAIEAALARDASSAAAAAFEERLARSVERHEVQHIFDAAQGLAMPPALAAFVGDRSEPTLTGGSVATIAVAELSAYLAQLADGDLPRVQLASLASYLLDPALWGSGECYAALVVARELAAELGLGAPELVERRRIDRALAAALFGELSRQPPAAVQDAARASWARLFGRPLPALSRRQRGSQSAP